MTSYTTIAVEYDPKSHADYLRDIAQRIEDGNYGDWHERGRDISNLKMVVDRLVALQKEWMEHHNRDYEANLGFPGWGRPIVMPSECSKIGLKSHAGRRA